MEELLNRTLLTIGDFQLKIARIAALFAFIFLMIIFLKIIKTIIYKVNKFDTSKKYSIYNLIKYFLLILASIIGMQVVGFNLSVLLAGSAALLVGLGLGIQKLFSDYISGIIILIESTVKVNDIIEINGLVCSVEEIQLRTTTVLTRDDKYIILPNTQLTSQQLINWTHSKIASRFELNVGVDYNADVHKVMEILTAVGMENKEVLEDPKPFTRFSEFGESSLNFSLIFWSEHVFRAENIKSELRIRIFEMLKQNNIDIPYPQRVIHTKQSIQKNDSKNNIPQ